MSRLCAFLLAGLGLLAGAAHAGSLGADVSLGGDTKITTPVTGNKVVMGGQIEVQAPISGNLMAAGGQVTIEKPIGQDLYAGGGEVTLSATVGGNARVVSGSVEVTSDGRVQGDASLAGRSVHVEGPIGGRLEIGGDDVLIDSAVGGDVEAAGSHIALGPHARIAGRLRYSSAEQLTRDEAAVVSGAIEHSAPDGRWERWATHHRSGSATGDAGDTSGDEDWEVRGWPFARWPFDSPQWHGWMRPYHRYGLGFFGGLAILTALLIAALAPGLAQGLAATVSRQWGGSMLIGLAALVLTPILMVILLITIIGIPVALILGLAWLLLMFLGYAACGVALGELALYRLAPTRYQETGMRVLASALAMGAVIIAAQTPVLGGTVAFMATLTGIGALLLQFGRRQAPVAPAGPAGMTPA